MAVSTNMTKNSRRAKHRMGIEKRRSIAGFLFILPWIIGFVGLFVRPLLSSFIYSINTTTITTDGLKLQFAGFGSYQRAFLTDMYYVRYLAAQLGSMVYNVPVIIAFSLLMAVIINGRFHGRTFVRSVFFLPVIAGSGIILSIMHGDAMSNSILAGTRSSMLFQTTGLKSILLNTGLSLDIVNFFMGIISNIFVLTWKSGLQILLFLAGLQTVSKSLYESARIEGATAWEIFWKITFPMISPMLVLNVTYTIIDSFTDFSNQVMQYIYSFAKMLDFTYSSALAWIYFAIVMTVVGIVYAIINRYAVYTVD